MPSQSASGDPLSPSTRGFANVAIDAFTPREWELLVRLPGRVIVAATHTGNPRRTVVEGLAGLEAMAAGRSFDSDLVRAVVAAVYAETPTTESEHAAGLLRSCREAVKILGRRADPADSAAYRQWVQSIAARVCAGSSRRTPTPEQLGPADRRFLADLAHALAMI